MDYERLHVHVEDGIGHVVLNKPDEYNRMPPAFWRELPAAIRALDASGEVRVAIISSTGKHFSAGLDISSFGSDRQRPTDPGRAGEQARRHLEQMQATISTLEQARMPVIAAIQGGAVGGGVDLAAACDLRYCTKDAFFCIQEINIGLAADVGTLQRLPYLIPDGLMRELAYTGRRMYADEAHACGLVSRIFTDAATMMEEVTRIACTIAAKSPLAIHSTKHLLNYGRAHSVADTLHYQTVWMAAVSQGGEMARHFEAKAAGTEAVFDDLPPIQDL
ncbi:MAG: enoyl-CoA hydratase/isomerase family protein [Pseudomonadales bacterium]|nr:enoyl-CoA hydratase/isomerase family protein [Pseudomonadales bacterium]